jgi:hypothetical protein
MHVMLDASKGKVRGQTRVSEPSLLWLVLSQSALIGRVRQVSNNKKFTLKAMQRTSKDD